MIEHVASSNGAFYTLFMGDADYIGDDVTAYYVSEEGTPVLLQRASNPSSRADVERIRARREKRRVDQEAAAKQRREQLKLPSGGDQDSGQDREARR